MKAYLKSGQVIRVSQQTAEAIVEVKTSGKQNYVIERSIMKPKPLYLFIDPEEVVAIK